MICGRLLALQPLTALTALTGLIQPRDFVTELSQQQLP